MNKEENKIIKDDDGKLIDVGNIVRITDNYGTYDAPVIFKDGMFTIDKFKAVQVKNKDGWFEGLKETFPNQNKKHDQVESYGFLVHWGESFASPIKSYSLKKLKLIK